jgi:hypothetical protein
MVEQDHTILIEDEDGAAVIGDIINSIQDDHGRVGLEISTVDIAI